jgi:hypothetical protein
MCLIMRGAQRFGGQPDAQTGFENAGAFKLNVLSFGNFGSTF